MTAITAAFAWVRDLLAQSWTGLAGHPYLIAAAVAGALITACAIGLIRARSRS
jgi:hypothetical protein